MPDRGIEEVRDVKHIRHLHTGREVLLELLDLSFNRSNDVVSIRSSYLRDHPSDSRVAIGEGVATVAEASELDLCHVLEANDIARGFRLEDDILVLSDAL